MENDKLMSVRERLIDFLNWHDTTLGVDADKESNSLFIDEYLKSINESSGEALTLADNEAKEKTCRIPTDNKAFCSALCDYCEYYRK